jgi:hypothetical protein
VPIRIGVTDYDYAEVTSGLEGGETVSLVTPAEEAGKVQQAFGAAARGGRAGGQGGEGRGGSVKSASGQSAPPGSGGRGTGGARSGGGGERRGPSGS